MLKRHEGSNYVDIYLLNIFCLLKWYQCLWQVLDNCAASVFNEYINVCKSVMDQASNSKAAIPMKAKAIMNSLHLSLTTLLKNIIQGSTHNYVCARLCVCLFHEPLFKVWKASHSRHTYTRRQRVIPGSPFACHTLQCGGPVQSVSRLTSVCDAAPREMALVVDLEAELRHAWVLTMR